MKKILTSMLLIAACTLMPLGSSQAADGDTLRAVKERGYLICGVSQGLPGFSNRDDAGKFTGIDVDYCRALAAAIFSDTSNKFVRFAQLSAKARFAALTSGEIDVLSRNTTWTFERDSALGISFVGVNYYDGQGFMVREDLGVSSAEELDGSAVCTNAGTTTELNMADYFRTNNMEYEAVAFEKTDEAVKAYDDGRCDVYTTDASGLAANRTRLKDPSAHVILPEIISKEPLGPAVRHGDANWEDIARWTLNALITAEELGVTAANADSMTSSTNPEIRRLLGVEKNLGGKLNLNDDFAKMAIKAVGNYGEIFERSVGVNTPLGLERGLNQLWTKGGILYSSPFR